MKSTTDIQTRSYLRAQEVAALLGISLRTVTNWRQRRVIPHHKIGRVVLFRRDEIEAAITRFRVAAVGEPHLAVNASNAIGTSRRRYFPSRNDAADGKHNQQPK